MIFRVAVRSLASRPLRSGVLACGFGLGIGVMANLLGIGEVILEQSRSPQLAGGGDARIVGTQGSVRNARFLMRQLASDPQLAPFVEASSPVARRQLWLLRDGAPPLAIAARGGIPSRERALGDYETARVEAWRDTPADAGWTDPSDDALLRAMDRFHPVPTGTPWDDSWAEWLYFNARGATHGFYLTYLVGPHLDDDPARRVAGVRLQLDAPGGRRSFSASGTVDAARLLETAPDLGIAGSTVRLEGGAYRLELELTEELGGGRRGPAVRGSFVLAPDGGAASGMPPYVVHGADGWRSGYVVPVLSGRLDGRLEFEGENGEAPVTFEAAPGYHDHNWGFWRDVSWQWGQVEGDALSIVFGRIFPPAEAADPTRLPGFLAVVQPDGPPAFAAGIRIEETDRAGDDAPESIRVVARGPGIDLTLDLAIGETLRSAMGDGPLGGGRLEFLQMQAEYTVAGRIGEREVRFVAPGAAETWRGGGTPVE